MSVCAGPGKPRPARKWLGSFASTGTGTHRRVLRTVTAIRRGRPCSRLSVLGATVRPMVSAIRSATTAMQLVRGLGLSSPKGPLIQTGMATTLSTDSIDGASSTAAPRIPIAAPRRGSNVLVLVHRQATFSR